MGKKLIKLFYRVSHCSSLKNQSEKNIEKCNKLMNELIDLLPFKNEKEKEQYLDICATFKFWESWRDATMKIIKGESL